MSLCDVMQNPCLICLTSHLCSLKTSLTKWKPDFDSAASEYAKAGKTSVIPERGVMLQQTSAVSRLTQSLSPALSCVLQERQAVRSSKGRLPEGSWISDGKQDVSSLVSPCLVWNDIAASQLCHLISLTWPTDFFMLQSKCLNETASLNPVPLTNTHVRTDVF